MSNLLSIVIPAHNASATIGSCLRSILDCATDGVEIIVVDDGSSDGTKDVCHEFPSSIVKVYRQDNAGVSVARNVGIDCAAGDYIMFVDADDILIPEWYEIVSAHFGDRDDVVVFSDNARKERYSREELVASIVGMTSRTYSKAEMMLMPWASSPVSRLFSRHFLNTNKIRFNKNINNGEDALFNLEVFLSTDCVRFVREPIYRYRIHSGSATHTFDQRFFASNETYLARLGELLSSSGLYSDKEVSLLVDYSFCQSVDVMAFRAARSRSVSECFRTAIGTQNDPLVLQRVEAGVNITNNSLRERVIYRLMRSRRFFVAVFLLHIALILRGRQESQERWVTI